MRYFIAKWFLVLCVIVTCANALTAQPKVDPYKPRKDHVRVPRQPFERYFTHDRFNREITFYLSEAGPRKEPLPLTVFIQGSECSSLFHRQNGVVVPSLGHITLQEITEGKARVLIVEKPGIQFLNQSQGKCPSEFNREHTLERWAEAVEAAIRASQELPKIRKNQTLVIGHSEGGLVACRVARDLPGIVTQVASLAGGGPSQLFDLLTLTRKGYFFRNVSEEPEARVKYLLDQWQAIQADPMNAEKLFFGFAYLRWSTFLASSTLEELLQVSAKIYVAQGTEDAAVDPASSDVLFAQLRAHGKQAIYDRVEGADHSFNLKGNLRSNGWQEQLNRIVIWFLKS